MHGGEGNVGSSNGVTLKLFVPDAHDEGVPLGSDELEFFPGPLYSSCPAALTALAATGGSCGVYLSLTTFGSGAAPVVLFSASLGNFME